MSIMNKILYLICILTCYNANARTNLVDPITHLPLFPQDMNTRIIEKNAKTLQIEFHENNLVERDEKIKQHGYEIAKRFYEAKTISEITYPQMHNVSSKLCTQEDFDSDWYPYWSNKMLMKPIYHRKPWEFSYIMQVAFEHGVLAEGSKALGFGCGEEPIPSLLCSMNIQVVATDCPPEIVHNGWLSTGQHSTDLLAICKEGICPKEKFLEYCQLKFVDMNNIPQEILNGSFNFVWSACSLEHLGTIQKGLEFICNSVKALSIGGIAVHTTEFSLSDDFVDNCNIVTFQPQHLENLHKMLGESYEMHSINYSEGTSILDNLIDVPPYSSCEDEYPLHLKLALFGIPCTSVGIIIKRVS